MSVYAGQYFGLQVYKYVSLQVCRFACMSVWEYGSERTRLMAIGLVFFTSSPFHCGPEQPRIQTEVLGHSFVLVPSLFGCSALLDLLARLAALTRSPARSLGSLPRSWESDWLDGYLVCVFFCFGPQCISTRHASQPFYKPVFRCDYASL